MCGRYTIRVDAGLLARRFGVAMPELPSFTPRYNVAPTQQLPVVVHGNARRLAVMRWGLIPRWAKDGAIGTKMINARAETLTEKPSFRPLLRTRRCLVPASGFYEWDLATRTPHHIHVMDASVFAFAGLYDVWRDHEGHEVPTYAIITTTPNALVAPIHDRMLVILRPEDEDAWLDPDEAELRALPALLRPYPAEAMADYPVARAVNSPRHDGPKLLAPGERLSDSTGG
jgi:putative SOS response-associated peptidase YedK